MPQAKGKHKQQGALEGVYRILVQMTWSLHSRSYTSALRTAVWIHEEPARCSRVRVGLKYAAFSICTAKTACKSSRSRNSGRCLPQLPSNMLCGGIKTRALEFLCMSPNTAYITWAMFCSTMTLICQVIV
eukprot:1051914-Pelagomonas_calceolata.AAC.1